MAIYKFGIFDFLLIVIFVLVSLSFTVPLVMQVALSISDADEQQFEM